MLERNRWIKSIPNALTLCNSLCGYAAILITIQAYKYNDPASPDTTRNLALVFALSACMILFAMVFDALDGFAARILNAASMHGIQMDSLADMVTFGVAPATLVAIMAHNLRHLENARQFIPICILCAVYLGCAALRLATYNVHAILQKKSGDKFSGLPSPGAAAAICSLVIYFAYREGEITHITRFLPQYAAFLGILMVSNVPYIHFAKWLLSVRRNRFRLALSLLALVGWGVSAIAFDPLLFPVILVNAYVIWGPLAFFAVKLGFVKPQPDLIPDIPEEDPSK